MYVVMIILVQNAHMFVGMMNTQTTVSYHVILNVEELLEALATMEIFLKIVYWVISQIILESTLCFLEYTGM